MARRKKTEGSRYDATNNPGSYGVVPKRQMRALKIVRDVFRGTLHIQDQGSEYLPQWPKEEAEAYKTRLAAAVLFNGYKRTVKGLAGMVYRKDPVLGEKMPPEIAAELADVDLQGRDLATFGREHLEDGMIDGHACIFVDMQEIPQDAAIGSLADERRLGLRPYWVTIRKENIRRFQTARIGGRLMLTEIAWAECSVERVAEFKEEEVHRVRELTLRGEIPEGESRPRAVVRWTLYRQAKKGDDSSWLTEGTGILGDLQEIPVAVTYTGAVDFLESEPPLLDMAIENLAHLRKRSDLDNIEHVACVPILALSGVTDDVETIAVGPAIGMKFADPQGGAEWAEVTGEGMKQVAQSIKEIEHRMAVLGLSLLMSETRAAETATSKRIDKGESDSQLSSAARSHQQAMNQALRFHAMWKGVALPQEEAGVTINQDFESLKMEPTMVAALQALVEANLLSVETLWAMLQQGEVLPDNFDAEVERDRIQNGDLSQLAKIAEQLKTLKTKPGVDPERKPTEDAA